jgi:hypothetical protein
MIFWREIARAIFTFIIVGRNETVERRVGGMEKIARPPDPIEFLRTAGWADMMGAKVDPNGKLRHRRIHVKRI